MKKLILIATTVLALALLAWGVRAQSPPSTGTSTYQANNQLLNSLTSLANPPYETIPFGNTQFSYSLLVPTGDVSLVSPGIFHIIGTHLTAQTCTTSPCAVTSAIVDCNAATGPIAVDLPASGGLGVTIYVFKTDSTSNACTITPAGSDKINGGSSFALNIQNAAATLVDATLGDWLVSSGPPGNLAITNTLNFNNWSGININQLDLSVLTAPALSAGGTCTGTCTTTYTYEITCVGDEGESVPSASQTVTNAASLSASNFNTLTWTGSSACHGGYNVYGRVAGSLGLLATVGTATYKDTGSVAPGAAPPTINTTGQISAGRISGTTITASAQVNTPKIVLPGSSSGQATLTVPAAAGTPTFEFPTTNGSTGQMLQTDGSGVTSWAAPPLSYGSVNLQGANDGTNPTTTFDVTADRVITINPTTKVATLTTSFSANDLVVGAQTGSQANGRDQAAAFGNNVFFHLYAITGSGQPAALLASLAAPPTGPTLPTNYTAWAYLGTFLTDGSGNLLSMYVRGNTVYYQQNQTLLNAGSATTSTNIPIASFVPSTATQYELFYATLWTPGTTGGDMGVYIALVSGTLNASTAFFNIRVAAISNANAGGTSGWIELPYISGGPYYKWDLGTTNTTGQALYLQVQGYRVPNGAS